MTKPTKRQIEAFRLVDIHGLSQAEAAGMMGITQPEVSRLLKRLEQDFFIVGGKTNHHRTLISIEDMGSAKIICKF